MITFLAYKTTVATCVMYFIMLDRLVKLYKLTYVGYFLSQDLLEPSVGGAVV